MSPTQRMIVINAANIRIGYKVICLEANNAEVEFIYRLG
jgi:hypothetical protein